jgi:hypothetical protein
MVYLPGCGVEFVSWCPQVKPQQQKLGNRYPTPIQEMTRLWRLAPKDNREQNTPRISGRRLRAVKKLVWAQVDSWEKLASLQERDFKSWKQYGRLSHEEVRKMAKEHGLDIPEIS